MKRKLKRWVKVVTTIILIVVSIVLYSYTGVLGELAQNFKIYQLLCIGTWSWLLVGQIMIYSYIWSK